MDRVSKKALIERIEYIMSYLLSKKYDCNIKIYYKKDEITNGNNSTSKNIAEE